MGIDGPRSPAVHRGARILDAISSGAATTPAALSGALGLPKSSIADLLGTLEDVGFVARGADGSLHAGASLVRPVRPRRGGAPPLSRLREQPDLDGHTVSLVQLFGNQVVFVDVRPGRHPLPLTPRPGQRATAAACAGAVAILSSMPVAEAADAVRAAAAHLGLSDDEVQRHARSAAPRRRSSLRIAFATRGPAARVPGDGHPIRAHAARARSLARAAPPARRPARSTPPPTDAEPA